MTAHAGTAVANTGRTANPSLAKGTDTTMTMMDEYPSRREARPSIEARRDPIVYGAPRQDDELAPSETEKYVRDGYLSFEQFFDAGQVTEMCGEMDRLWRKTDRADETVIREPEGDAIRSIFNVHRHSPLFDRLVRDKRMLAIMEQILGGPVYVHQSRINYKSGFEGEEFYWHSDFETWHVEDGMPRMRAASVSIALCDNTSINGPLMLIPGSHQHYVTCVGETPDDHFKTSLRRQEYGVPDPASLRWLAESAGRIDAPVGPAGSMVLFDCNTMHGSNSNITPFPRSNLFVVYNSVENALAAPFGGTKPRPLFIAGRDFTPLTPV